MYMWHPHYTVHMSCHILYHGGLFPQCVWHYMWQEQPHYTAHMLCHILYHGRLFPQCMALYVAGATTPHSAHVTLHSGDVCHVTFNTLMRWLVVPTVWMTLTCDRSSHTTHVLSNLIPWLIIPIVYMALTCGRSIQTTQCTCNVKFNTMAGYSHSVYGTNMW